MLLSGQLLRLLPLPPLFNECLLVDFYLESFLQWTQLFEGQFVSLPGLVDERGDPEEEQLGATAGLLGSRVKEFVFRFVRQISIIRLIDGTFSQQALFLLLVSIRWHSLEIIIFVHIYGLFKNQYVNTLKYIIKDKFIINFKLFKYNTILHGINNIILFRSK